MNLLNFFNLLQIVIWITDISLVVRLFCRRNYFLNHFNLFLRDNFRCLFRSRHRNFFWLSIHVFSLFNFFQVIKTIIICCWTCKLLILKLGLGFCRPFIYFQANCILYSHIVCCLLQLYVISFLILFLLVHERIIARKIFSSIEFHLIKCHSTHITKNRLFLYIAYSVHRHFFTLVILLLSSLDFAEELVFIKWLLVLCHSKFE